MPLFVRFLEERLRHLVELIEGLRRVDDELHRQAVAAGQRRRLEGDDLRAGDAGLTSCCMIGWSWLEVLARSSHGFSTMPAIDWPGTSSWKTWSVSGWLAKMS